MNFVVFAWIGSLAYAAETILAKLTSRYGMKNPWYLNFLWSTFILLLILPVAYLSGQTGWPNSWKYILWAAFFYGLSNILYILALCLLDITVFSPLFNLRVAFSVIIAGLFLHESLTPIQLILVVIIMIAGIFVNAEEKFNLKKIWSKGLIIALAEMIDLSLMGVFIKLAMSENSYWQVTLPMMGIGEILMIFTIPLFIKEVKTLTGAQAGSTALLAVASVVGTLACNKAFAENVSVTTVILSVPLSMIIAGVLSYIKPEILEHHTTRIYIIRFTAAFVMIAGAIKLSL